MNAEVSWLGALEPSHEARPGQPVDALGATCFRTDGAASLPSNRQRAGAAPLSGSVLVLWIVATGRHNGVISCWSGIGYCPAGRSQCGYALSPCHAGLGPSDRAHVVAPWLFALCEGSGFDPLYLGLTTARGKPSNPLGILKRPPTSDEAKGRALVVNTAA